jgi:hypothetical protein
VKNKQCRSLPMVFEALKSSNWDAKTLRHLNECKDCQEAVKVRNWVQQFALSLPEETPETPAQLIWFKARLAERQAVQKKVQRGIVYLQTALQFAFSIIFLVLTFQLWDDMEGWIYQLEHREFDFLAFLTNLDSLASIVLTATMLIFLGIATVFNTLAYQR